MSQVRIAGFVLLLVMTACGRKLEGTVTLDNKNAGPAIAPPSQMSAAQIIERYRSLDDSHDATIKMKALITSQEDPAGLNAPQLIQLTMYRRREPDSRLLILAEFTSPPQDRERD